MLKINMSDNLNNLTNSKLREVNFMKFATEDYLSARILYFYG